MAENLRDQLKMDLSWHLFLTATRWINRWSAIFVTIFVRLVFPDFPRCATVLTSKNTTSRQDIYNVFESYVTENDLPIQKMVSITIDGVPSMMAKQNGLAQLCHNDKIFPLVFSYYFILHQQVFRGQIMKMVHIMKSVNNFVNLIWSKITVMKKIQLLDNSVSKWKFCSIHKFNG